MSETIPDAQTKVCPQCAEEVKAAARVCRFCRFEFEVIAAGVTTLGQEAVAPVTQTAKDLTGPPHPREAPPPTPPPPSIEQITETASGGWKVAFNITVNDNIEGRAGIERTTAIAREHSFVPSEPVRQADGRLRVLFTKGQQPTPEAGAGDGTKQGLIGLIALGGLGLGGAGLFQSPDINWAMVAGGVVILVVAVVLMVAVYPNGMPDTSRERAELKRVTGNWTVPFVVRSYKNDDNGRALASKEAAYLTQHGYTMAGQSGTGSHVNVGRTASRVVLTGGLGLIFGASRSKGTIDITFVRQ